MIYAARATFGTVGLLALLALFAPQTSSAAIVNISMGPNYFTPANITINAGDSVVWRNTDNTAHTVTSNSGHFDSGTLQRGATYSLTFNNVGTYSYRCLFHNGMVGTITVVAGSNYTQPYYSTPQTYVAPTTYYPPQTYTNNATADQLRAQAQTLLARVQQLQAQLAGGGGAVPIAGVTYDSSSCPLIGRSLKRGSSGDDVRRLQEFLARDTSVYPEGEVTGHYGTLTEKAVQRWQAKYNVVSSGTPDGTGYGVVGPRTAAAIAILCTTGSYGGVPGPGGSTAPVGGFIQVTPVAGNAPLNVAIQATVNTVNSCAGALYTLDYGDGTPPAQIAVPAGSCQQMVQTLAHQYRYGGTHLITLSAGGHRTTATVQVYGAGPPTSPPPASGNDSVSARPRSGDAPLEVEFTGTINAAASCNGGEYELDFGDGDDRTIPFPADGCRPYSFELTHRYTSGGDFTARLRDTRNRTVDDVEIEVDGVEPSDSWIIIDVTPAVGGDPFVSAVRIEYPACAAYSIDWGDGTVPSSTPAQNGCSTSSANATINHTYTNGGNYTVSLRDGSGNVKATSGITIVD